MCEHYLVGVDEVGRGPLAGPLCLGACAVPRSRASAFRRLFGAAKDCKQLSHPARVAWLGVMRKAAANGIIVFTTAFVGSETIDRRGMAHALRKGVHRALEKLELRPSMCRVLLDGGLKAPSLFEFQETIIGGDERELTIALASIAAKVRRDAHMVRAAARFPSYGFEAHKGYGTRAHYAALRAHGLCPIHRRSFLRGML